MDNEELQPVTTMVPYDVTGVKDAGMQALIILARSLDWNVMWKPHQPVVIRSRSGVTRRIPTDTSIRASLFQTLLSSIMLHSTNEPTPELIEQIIDTVKPNHDQARRMRIAVGEDPRIHAERLLNLPHLEDTEPEAAIDEALYPDMSDEPEPLPEADEVLIVWEAPPEDAKAKYVPPPEPKERKLEGKKDGPADGGNHGKVVDQHRYQAKASLHMRNDQAVARLYDSRTSDERVWEDGYIDYVCIVCGLAYKTPRGVGSHKQMHIREGAILPDTQVQLRATSRQIVGMSWEKGRYTKASDRQSPVIGIEDALEQVRNLLFPDIGQELARLKQENEELRARYDKVSGDLRALRDLLKGIPDE